jgi:EmrB/QacA subfamily drug resistance transporter
MLVSVTSHRKTVQALGGLLLALFVSTLSTTVVTTALPKMIGSLHGTQTAANWVVTATLLTTTATTPIWGKMADLFSKKLLVQAATLVFMAGSIVAGASQNVGELIAGRAIQGVGAGGLQALVQISIGTMIPPRERGRYAAYQSSATALATIGGPLLGGLIVDQSWLGWRWCFLISLPISVLALVVLQRTLNLPVIRREQVSIDFLGATLIASAVSVVLIWVSFVDRSFSWLSWQTGAMVGTGVILLLIGLVVETRVPEPIVPLHILKHRAVVLAILGSLAAGTAMFGASVFIAQYFQLARDRTPTQSGLLTIPMMVGILLSSLIGGYLLSRVGQLKPFLLTGATILTAGFGCLALIDHQTPLVMVCLPMAMIGIGIGMTSQNFVLLVQNSVSLKDIGAATSTISFFRSLGGTIGVAVLGAVLAGQVGSRVSTQLAEGGLPPERVDSPSEALQNPAVSEAAKAIIRESYGDVTGHIFLISTAVAFLGVLAVMALRPVSLRRTLDLPEELDIAAANTVPDAEHGAVTAAQPGGSP